MKHNNQICNQHFRKDWQLRVKTWFNQPASKVRRRNARAAKAKMVAPRPVNALRPVVRCQTVKYNTKVRAGRGFTLEEIKAAGFVRKEARGLGIAVDHRRKNRSEEAFQLNVQRLKTYKSKLVVFPRNSRKPKNGDASVEEQAQAAQVTSKQVLPIEAPLSRADIKPRAITKDESEFRAYSTLRKLRTDTKLWGARERRAFLAAEEAKSSAKGKKKK